MFLSLFIASCIDSEKDNWDKYADWRATNESWLNEQIAKKNTDGTDYYEKVVASWNPQAKVYIHYFNDRALTANNLSPIYTSTIDVKYIGRLYNDVAFDSSYLRTTPADSIYRTKLTNVIEGWTVAFMNMHVGDSCQILIPYASAYGATGSGTTILPYSALQFNVKLVGIPGYEIKP